MLTPEERFTAKVNRAGPVHPELGTRCHLWIGSHDPASGYGKFFLAGRLRGAHVAAVLLFIGPIPPGKQALHRCDVRLCVNADHLRIGTQRENVADMIRKGRGRWRAGETHPRSTISDADVVKLRRLRADGHTLEKLGQRFGISPGQAGKIARGLQRVLR